MATKYIGQDFYPHVATDFNEREFHIRQLLKQANIATVVKVMSVTTQGDLSPVGFVDVMPMVNMLDGDGKSYVHGTIHNLPYLRIFAAGGSKAVILDPEVGDLGIAVFADRDISAVKRSKQQSNPGSRRRNDMADGMYLGGILSGNTPTSFVQFKHNGTIVMGVGSSSSALECVVASDHAQIKKKGDTSLHLTIDAQSGKILSGKAIEIAPDPFPQD